MVVGGLLGLGGLVGCAAEPGGDAAGGSGSDGGAAGGAVADGSAGSGPSGGGGDTVSVYLTEYAIGIPETLPSRGTVLRVLNEGAEIHNLRFRSEAGEIVWSLDEEMSPGDAGLYELEVEPGDYTVICDFAGHDSRGMRTTVTIEGAPGG